jgi:metallopeptidase MepB
MESITDKTENIRNGQPVDVVPSRSDSFFQKKALPQAPILFKDTPESLANEAKCLTDKFQAMVNAIVAGINKDHATFENIIKPFAEVENEYLLQSRRIKFYASIHHDKEVRSASIAASKQLAGNQIDFYMRDDFYQLVDEVFKGTQSGKTRAKEDEHYLHKLRQEFLRGGVALPPSLKRERLKQVQKKIDELTAEGRKNLNGNTSGLWLERHELRGMPKSFLGRLPTKNEDIDGDPQSTASTRVWVRMKDPDTIPIWKNEINSKTRRKVYEANMGRCVDNVPVYTELFALRREAAQIMGFSNHAEYRISYKMVKSAGYVNSILKEIEEKAQQQRNSELRELQKLKNEELLSNGFEEEPQLYVWDRLYYDRLTKEKKYDLDHNALAEYFPLEHTLGEMFKIYERIFGVRAVEVSPQVDWVWHETVKLYSMWDADDDDQFLGFLYLDIFPREAKYSHAGHFGLGPVSSVP